MRGIVRYDADGRSICEICGASCDSLANHAFYYHKIDGKEYRKRYGLNRSQSLASLGLQAKKRRIILADQPLIKRNLMVKGAKSRFRPDHKTWKGKKLRTQGKLIRKPKENDDPPA